MNIGQTSSVHRLRRLAKEDLDAVVAIDTATIGRSRHPYFERRLTAALREPDVHLQYAVDDGNGLAGYVLARRLEGEFGGSEPGLRLEAIGVRQSAQGHGIGHVLVSELARRAAERGVRSLQTTALWTQHAMLGFLDYEGFTLGGNQVVSSPVHAGPLGASEASGVTAPQRSGAGTEVDYSAASANDFEALARDRCDVRALAAADLPELVRIDRRLTGRDREAFIRRMVDEAMLDSAIRVSLTARFDGVLAGFVMAKVDSGDFGRTEPVAVIDTIGVDPEYLHQGIGHALLSQLFINLAALRVESVETVVSRSDFELLKFLYGIGFEPSQRLSFVKRLGQ